jgi:hypothetical protein
MHWDTALDKLAGHVHKIAVRHFDNYHIDIWEFERILFADHGDVAGINLPIKVRERTTRTIIGDGNDLEYILHLHERVELARRMLMGKSVEKRTERATHRVSS